MIEQLVAVACASAQIGALECIELRHRCQWLAHWQRRCSHASVYVSPFQIQQRDRVCTAASLQALHARPAHPVAGTCETMLIIVSFHWKRAVFRVTSRAVSARCLSWHKQCQVTTLPVRFRRHAEQYL
jgi:hypothetical protein